MIYYAGIGSRSTPTEILDLMTDIAVKLNSKDYVLRSGGAHGADQAFENGAGVNKQIFTPWPGYNGYNQQFIIPQQALQLAEEHHPNWKRLGSGAKLLMARNCQQILGPNLDDPVEFVICWTKDGCYKDEQRSNITGGTGQAISIACNNNIPVFNLKNPDQLSYVLNNLVK